MKKLALLLLMFFSWHTSRAQQEIFVTGQVLDSLTGKGLETCSVGFFDAKNHLVAGTVTDASGYFELTLLPGKYKMVLDFVGYRRKEIPVLVRQNNQFLGTYRLAPDQQMLKEVTVKARAARFKVDKDVYLVTRKLKAGAANTDDVLDKIPGVTLDRYNNQIKVDGQTNIKILVDGLEKDEAYIRNLNPERIRKIEIIRDPSGKYALDGYVAVINIILKRNYTGTEANLSNQSVTDSDVADKSHWLPAAFTNAGITYTYNKLNVYGQYNIYLNDFYFPSNTVYRYANGERIEKLPGSRTHNLWKDVTNDRITFGVDYYLNPRHTLSFESGWRNVLANKDRTTINYLVKEYANNVLQNSYSLDNFIDDRLHSGYQSLFYVGKPDENREIRMDLTFSSYKKQSDNRFLQDGNTYRTQYSRDAQNAVKFNGEYHFDLNEKSRMEAGYGFYRQQSTNDLQSVYGNQNHSQHFQWQDTRHKVFAYFGHRFNERLSMKLGLAGEMSTPEVSGQKMRYFIYQPYVDLKYKLSKMLSLKMKYRTESTYPTLSQANPNTVYVDPQTVHTGNPSLAPQVTHKLALRANFFGGVMFLEPYYHFSENYIGRVSRLRNDGIVEQTYENLGHYRHYGLQGSVTVPFGKKLFWQNYFNVYHSGIKYLGRSNAFNDYHLESNLIYADRKKGWNAGVLYQRAMNKIITAQGYHKWNNDFWGLLVQKSMWKNRLNLMVLYMLPVDFGVDYVQGEYVRTPQYESLTQYDIHLLKNVLVFRLNYRFSHGKATRKTKKNIKEELPEKEKKGLF